MRCGAAYNPCRSPCRRKRHWCASLGTASRSSSCAIEKVGIARHDLHVLGGDAVGLAHHLVLVREHDRSERPHLGAPGQALDPPWPRAQPCDGMLFEIEAYNRMIPTEDRREGIRCGGKLIAAWPPSLGDCYRSRSRRLQRC